ncbi:hypothetical protein CONCODRAFT_8471 [Conidiobolus coronatus NRRL 28638]|uniref:Uncharacterized protein n=1 Tax=Conidiobolus coronatus (strain ATCC 28846 / CBS 209.66 / NRRL 28638) TaxID=796925 RepID=A0A137P263_CONC2|nr:hypothetical protein CONCODRAFT_8471 [Conidiobolus coronatus NRRL 28638]|eukprot:KXN69133.1 hypothetical protein CONCODRAFT_8471 [Conidiobolus coronatus NRRL 28638]
MNLDMPDIALICLAFTVVILLDFIVVEYVLKLGVFSLGTVWLRVVLILDVATEGIPWLLMWLYPEQANKYAIPAGALSVSRMCMYYHMILEQNLYWMSDKIKRIGYTSLIFYVMANIVVISSFITYNLGLAAQFVIIYTHYVDLVVYLWLSIMEILVSYKVYMNSKKKVKAVSLSLWRKIQFGTAVIALCAILDFVVLVMENAGDHHLAYTIKPPIFGFKIVFECLCFQFIKGIVISIGQ